MSTDLILDGGDDGSYSFSICSGTADNINKITSSNEIQTQNKIKYKYVKHAMELLNENHRNGGKSKWRKINSKKELCKCKKYM